jgi:uncharacterized protein YkwD
MNWVDLTIIAIIILFGIGGYFKGFIKQLYDVFSLIMAFLVSVKFYVPFSGYLATQFSISANFGKILGFFVIWMAVQFILNFSFHFIYLLIPEKFRKSLINRIAGSAPGIFWGIVFVAIFVTMVSILPVQNLYKKDVTESKISSWLISRSQYFESYASKIFGGAINDTLTFLTVKPNSDETVDLGFKTSDIKIDEKAEEEMLKKLNEERTSRGLDPLVMDEKLRELARAHSKDMFIRGYFAHNDPDGKDPFDRMDENKIKYQVAGENLALAPNVDLAHEGLMNSPGHRANILTSEYGKVGIGVIDGGRYGKMFSQEFTD